jgi:hypothetical protein
MSDIELRRSFERRCELTAGSFLQLAVALNLKSQSTAVKINRNIWSLTKDTVDDSATVRLITIVTLIFLPASFVTVSPHMISYASRLC